MKKNLFIFVSTLLCSSFADQFWGACHNSVATPTSVTSPQCNSSGCTVSRGGSLNGTVTFTPTAAYSSVTFSLHVKLDPNQGFTEIVLTTPGVNNACTTMSPGCPTVANREETFTLNFPLIPESTLLFEDAPFEILFTSGSSQNIVCLQVNATVLES